MIINNKILYLPPYISTSWSHIRSLHMKDKTLIITLISDDAVSIQDLPQDVIENIFQAHRTHLEQTDDQSMGQPDPANPFHMINESAAQGMESIRFGIHSIDGLGSAMQHNSDLANSPDLPLEFLEKIAAIAKIVAPEDAANLPQGELHCNCPHCQIARAINGQFTAEQPKPSAPIHQEEPISAEDLQFQQWQVVQTGDQLFDVINKLDSNEIYHVYLGTPIGCTCGEKGCVHIPAVLKS